MTRPLNPAFAALLLLAALSATGAGALAQCATELLDELANDDRQQGDRFAQAIATDGRHIIAGAYNDQIDTYYCGSAFLFDAATGELLHRFLPEFLGNDDFFGFAVDVSDAIALVGAKYDDDGELDGGTAFLFDCVTGAQLFQLIPDDLERHDHFGTSVAIGSGLAVAGAPAHRHGQIECGAAYLFDVETGEQLAELLPDFPEEDLEFGAAVAISGNHVLVGTSYRLGLGAAFLFDVSDRANPLLISTLRASQGGPSDRFGSALAIDGRWAVVGAPYDPTQGQYAGAAYLFGLSNPAAPQQVARLLRRGGGGYDFFGKTVALSGTKAMVGAWFHDDKGRMTHTAYLYDARTGAELVEFMSGDPFDRGFGRSVALHGARALVGSNDDYSNQTSWGSVYVFDVGCEPLLAIGGTCPGVTVLEATDCTPAGLVAFLYARGKGSLRVPEGRPCAGTPLGLDGSTVLGRVVRADAEGRAAARTRVPLQACGAVYLQALDVSSCRTSNVAVVE